MLTGDWTGSPGVRTLMEVEQGQQMNDGKSRLPGHPRGKVVIRRRWTSRSETQHCKSKEQQTQSDRVLERMNDINRQKNGDALIMDLRILTTQDNKRQ